MTTLKKSLLWTGIGLFIVVLAVAIISLFYLGGIVKNRVEALGPAMTKVDVTLDSASVWLLPGSVQLKKFVLGNPPEYKARIAFQANDISVHLNSFTAFSKKVVLTKIVIKSPEVTLEGGLKRNNLTEIQKNVNAYVDSSPATTAPAAKPAATSVTSTNESSRKFEVDDLVITGAKVHVSRLLATSESFTIPLPDIHLTGLGQGPDGITAAEVMQKTLTALIDSAIETGGQSLFKLGGSEAEKLKKAGKGMDFKKAGEKLKGLFGQ